MRPSEMAVALQGLIQSRQPAFMWGPPGVGKSSLVRQAAEALGRELIDIRAVLMDPVDIRGLPTVQDGKAVWAQPGIYPQDPESQGIIFLDELPQAPPLTQSAFLQLALDRRIGEYTLPEGWVVIAAGNRQEDRTGAHRLISSLSARFIHLDLDVSLEDWQAWAIGANIAPEIRAFLNFKPGLLFQFEAGKNERSFASPRSWAFINNVLPNTPESCQHAVFSGCVSEGPAVEFLAFLRVYRELPNIDTLLDKATTATIPTSKPDVMYALVGALAEKSKAMPGLDNLATYGMRMPGEFSALMLRDTFTLNCTKTAGKVKGHDKLFKGKMSNWMAQHRSVLMEKN